MSDALEAAEVEVAEEVVAGALEPLLRNGSPGSGSARTGFSRSSFSRSSFGRSSDAAGRLLCARSDVVNSSTLKSAGSSFLIGTLILVPPFFLAFLLRLGNLRATRRTENDSEPSLCADPRCWPGHGCDEVQCRARHDSFQVPVVSRSMELTFGMNTSTGRRSGMSRLCLFQLLSGILSS